MKAELIQYTLNFLDRVEIKGHKERLALNDIVEELVAERDKQQADAQRAAREAVIDQYLEESKPNGETDAE